MPADPLPATGISPPDAPSEPRPSPPAPITAVQDRLPSHSVAENATARGCVDASRTPGTRKAYANWRRFGTWCHARHAQASSETPGAPQPPPPSLCPPPLP